MEHSPKVALPAEAVAVLAAMVVQAAISAAEEGAARREMGDREEQMLLAVALEEAVAEELCLQGKTAFALEVAASQERAGTSVVDMGRETTAMANLGRVQEEVEAVGPQ